MASKPIRRKNGQFGGSEGTGKTPPPSAPAETTGQPSLELSKEDTVTQAWAAYKGQFTENHTFQLWEREPALNVCEVCGKEAGNEIHSMVNPFQGELSRDPRYAPYEDAIWGWTVRNGGISSYYGGYDESKTIRSLIHLEACGVNHSKSEPPRITTLDQFGGTDEPSDSIEVSSARITCRCGAMRNITWRVYGGRSVNEIVFEVVREGDMQEDMTVVIPDPTGRPAKWLPDVIKKTSQKTAAPLAARRFIEDELIPTLYRAYYTQGKEDNRIWNRDEDRIAENTWEKVVYTVAQLDTDYLAVFKKLMAPFPKVPKDGLSFSEMRDYGWSSY